MLGNPGPGKTLLRCFAIRATSTNPSFLTHTGWLPMASTRNGQWSFRKNGLNSLSYRGDILQGYGSITDAWAFEYVQSGMPGGLPPGRCGSLSLFHRARQTAFVGSMTCRLSGCS